MQFGSRIKRNFWTTVVLGLVPDSLIGAAVAYVTGAGLVGIFFTVFGLQCLYLVLFLKDLIWGWFLFWIMGRKKFTSHYAIQSPAITIQMPTAILMILSKTVICRVGRGSRRQANWWPFRPSGGTGTMARHLNWPSPTKTQFSNIRNCLTCSISTVLRTSPFDDAVPF